MWFDVQAALAEIEMENAPRVAHVARVARAKALKSEDPAEAGHVQARPSCTRVDLTPDESDHYEERAAILEHDGGLPRPEAERRARLEVVGGKKYGPRETKGMTRLWPSE